jgi:hypothetical protein
MGAEPFDREMGLARVGGSENGADAARTMVTSVGGSVFGHRT